MQTRCAVCLILLFLLVSALVGCHDGGSETQPITIISGIASKGPIKAAKVRIIAIRDGAEDLTAPIGQGVTDQNGNYAVDIGAYTGPFLVEVTGGSFTDEVSGAAVTMKSPMRALFSNAVTGAHTIAVTPLTELAYKKASGAGALSAASIDDANAIISSYFNLDSIISILPDSGGVGEQKKYAAVLGSISQYISNKKGQNESLDDALARLFKQMGDEMENAGGLSLGTINDINTAIADFTNSGKNQTGVAVTPLPSPVSGLLKLTSAGTSTVGALDVTVNFPAGVKVLFDGATGEAAPGVVTVSGAAASGNCLQTAKFTPAFGGSPAQLHLGLITATGFGTGEFVTIRFDVEAGSSFPANAQVFSIAGLTALGTDGSSLSDITATPSTVAAEIK